MNWETLGERGTHLDLCAPAPRIFIVGTTLYILCESIIIGGTYRPAS